MSTARRPDPSDPVPSPDGGGGRRGSELLRAVEVMESLRGEHGDAWTHQQTHASLARYLLEETHEVLEVIEAPRAHGPGALADELGDLLFQILFHARVGQEAEVPWDIDDVARAFVAKMERRNPHVFGDREAGEQPLEDPADVDAIIAQWHAVKAAERRAAGEREKGWLDGVPSGLPALQTAAKAVHRARSAGRLPELLAAADGVAGEPGEDPDGWGGDLARQLLDLVVEAEARDVDPESALRALLTRLRGELPRQGAEPGPDGNSGHRGGAGTGTA
ncbi:MazG nucleotide pyrophosphohydrolase domain-containing protein [Brachybacterium sp. J153]|uniref:MazG nucleotide pyrophosphohydrolase domain-containing protein n=1 Tax=Brachybacterium sp. J153 TaxID=3116488 RepID=UPI002E7A5321|nr:MazG nucleotide pyrophosphohydrolase domain-containing protein [Brachybacterium sp. J153]MEE1619056.1 MazG nucleotide pyrophosphohydrolase domain-containing protein [Brachybacterium sp. J153]